MIHPGMATMLCFLATDARVDLDLQQLVGSVAVFNQISVDGDMSTSDTFVGHHLGPRPAPYDRMGSSGEALLAVAGDRDGDRPGRRGATCLITCTVDGGPDETARRAARSVRLIPGKAAIQAGTPTGVGWRRTRPGRPARTDGLDVVRRDSVLRAGRPIAF